MVEATAQGDRVLIAGLKGNMCSNAFVDTVLAGDEGGKPWLHTVGLIVIDDEDYTDCTHTRSNASGRVGLILRNYYHPTRVVSDRTLYFPLGWRTTDGGFGDDHSKQFTEAYIASQRNGPHAKVSMPGVAPVSQRPYRMFFVGSIRPGGRAEMEKTVREIAQVRMAYEKENDA